MNDLLKYGDDADMLFSDSPACTPSSQGSTLSAANEKVVDFIDCTFDHVCGNLNRCPPEEVYVELERVASTRKSQNPRARGQKRKVRYYWPGETAEEAWRFTCVLAILLEIKKAISSGVTVTKRDIYYHQPELFRNQAIVDKWVDDIALTCGVSRRDLMVTGSQKGLVCGLSRTERIQSIGQDLEQLLQMDVQYLRWILIVEKEASFNTLVEVGFDHSQKLGPGLLVTGKGYPDLQTRFFLRHILDAACTWRPTKLFGLFDGDPDGLEIYRCYRSGSQALAHETACLLPEIKWLGVDIFECLNKPEILGQAVPLTARDRSKARAMLLRSSNQLHQVQHDPTRRGLRTMLMLGVKLEIQGFDKVDGGIKGWLEINMASSLNHP